MNVNGSNLSKVLGDFTSKVSGKMESLAKKIKDFAMPPKSSVNKELSAKPVASGSQNTTPMTPAKNNEIQQDKMMKFQSNGKEGKALPFLKSELNCNDAKAEVIKEPGRFPGDKAFAVKLTFNSAEELESFKKQFEDTKGVFKEEHPNANEKTVVLTHEKTCQLLGHSGTANWGMNLLQSAYIPTAAEKSEMQKENLKNTISLFKGYPEIHEKLNSIFADCKTDKDMDAFSRLLSNIGGTPPRGANAPTIENAFISGPFIKSTNEKLNSFQESKLEGNR